MKLKETKDIQILPIAQFTGSESALQLLYSQIKDVCVDAFPHNTVLSFASAAHFFGVILLKGQGTGVSSRNVEAEAKVLRWELGEDAAVQPTSSTTAPNKSDAQLPVIGLTYLMVHTPSFKTSDVIGELNVGVIVDPLYRGRRYAYQAVSLTLAYAFEHFYAHRVQALVVDSGIKDAVVAFFTQMRFSREGTGRRGAYRPLDGVWKDVTYLAILQHEWKAKPLYKPAPKSTWDELYARHQREREELLNWENHQLKKSSSTDTLKAEPMIDKTKVRAELIRSAMEDDDNDYYYEDEDGEEYYSDEEELETKGKGKVRETDMVSEEDELERAIQLSISEMESDESFPTGATGPTGTAISNPFSSSASSWENVSSVGTSSRT